MASELARAIMNDKVRERQGEDKANQYILPAEKVVEYYKSVFKDRYYLEIQNHSLPEDKIINQRILELAEKYGIKVVATTDSHYLNKEDAKAHDIMIAIGSNITLDDPKMETARYPGEGYWVHTREEMDARFGFYKEAVDNTLEIAERCDNIKIERKVDRLPKLVGAEEEDAELRSLVFAGLRKRIAEGSLQETGEVIERVNMELKTIEQMGYAGYFLLVSDYVKWAKEAGILVGPGRGSAAGSLVSYLLDITDVNPLEFGLSFARFLNKGRAAYPDVSFPEYPLKKTASQ
jgi:DNA polymerase-3 subunit alpha